MKFTLKPTVACVLLALGADATSKPFEVVSIPQSAKQESPTARQTLKLNAAEFDPLTEQVRLVGFKMPATENNRYGLVQLHAGDKNGRQKIEAMGAHIINYLPHDAYVVEWGQTDLSNMKQSQSFRYVGEFLPEYKLSPALWDQVLKQGKAAGTLKIELIGHAGTSVQTLENLVGKFMPSAQINHSRMVKDTPQVRVSLQQDFKTAITGVIQSNEVMWVDKFRPVRTQNIDSVGVIQSDSPDLTGATIWNKGLIGTGQIVAVADSGLDRNMSFFSRYNSSTPQYTDAEFTAPGELGQLFPDRKVVGYFVQRFATPYDDDESCGEEGTPSDFHGTHVAGTVAGDSGTPASSTSANYDLGDGMAPHAQILFQDLGNTETGCLSGDGGYDMFLQAAKAGAMISSNSYGIDAEPDPALDGYYFNDQQVDAASYDIEDILIVFAAGNDGNDGIGHPGVAKNALTVGAYNHGQSTQVAAFSSRGPTYDGRQKPDIMAPGVGIVSAAGDLNNDNPPAQVSSAVKPLSGTSMATPTVSGGAALMRQYFTEGFYPSGSKNATDVMTPSGALMKSVLLNGTTWGSRSPAIDQGWGRIHLDNNLYFAGDSRNLRVWDLPNANGLATGEEMRFKVQVPAGEEFRATLAWFDPPAMLGSGHALINNLDLEVNFNGQVYKGNNWDRGVSVTGGRADEIDTVEQIRLTSPIAGEYEVVVKGTQVNGSSSAATLKQGFSLVTSQGVCSSNPGNPPSIDVILNELGEPVINLNGASNNGDYQVYRKQGGCGIDNSGYRFIGQLSGTSVLDGLLDQGTEGGNIYGYAVKSVDACGESTYSACKSIQPTACNAEPQFNTAGVTANAIAADFCSVSLQWSAGSSSCTSAPLVYNIYRSDEADFSPSEDNLLASGVRNTEYTDYTVDSNGKYHYLVTAVDSNGNESLNNDVLSVLTQGDDFVPGTYTDDPDTTTLAVLESPWRINNDQASTGTMSFHNANSGANYPNNTCAYLTLPAVELQSGATLSYDALYNLEVNWDGVVVEISTDGGNRWNDLPPAGGYPSSFSMTEPTPGQPINACGYPASQGAFSGAQNSFATFSSDLSAFAGQQVMIRWAFSSDPGAEEEGFYLDNIRIDSASSAGQCELKAITKNTAGPWYNPDQSGHGLFLEVSQGANAAPDTITTYWYAFLNNQPVWILGTGPTDGNSATLDMFVTDGAQSPPNFNSNDVNIIPWGELGLDFDLQNNVTVSWDSVISDFGSGSMDMTQLAFVSDSPKACLSGSYSDPAQPGHGYVVEIIGSAGAEVVLVTWYNYDNNGNQIWLIGSAPLQGDSATVPVSLFEGGAFPPNFVPGDVTGQEWGTLELDFSRLNALTVSWTANLAGYSDGQVAATKLTELKGRGCY